MIDYKNQLFLVIGLGASGLSASRFLLERGARVVASEQKYETALSRPEVRELIELGLEIRPESASFPWSRLDGAVVSPGISPKHFLYREAEKHGVEIIGEIELACREIGQPFIGITGTNGKTTVCALVTHVLNSCGRAAKALGNYGVPLTAEIGRSDREILVCELSSYQLETFKQPVIDFGVILNITPDHLDRYGTMQEYAKAKISMQNCIKRNGQFLVSSQVWKDYASLFLQPPMTFGFSPVDPVYCDTRSVFFKRTIEMFLPEAYRGKTNHEVENLMAAFAICSHFNITSTEFTEACRQFKKPPHRIEFVKTLRGIHFYNDSKGTNMDAVIRAVEALEGKVILIAGGVSKGAPFTQWADSFRGKVASIFAIGEAQDRIRQELGGYFSIILCESLETAVRKAFRIAERGDNVLLSPGCASFDMFRNFEHRGDCFKQIILGLSEEGGESHES